MQTLTDNRNYLCVCVCCACECVCVRACICVCSKSYQRKKTKDFFNLSFLSFNFLFSLLPFLFSQHVPVFKPYVMSAAADNVNVDIIKSKNSNVARSSTTLRRRIRQRCDVKVDNVKMLNSITLQRWIRQWCDVKFDNIMTLRGQFHQHFMTGFFVQKCFEQLFLYQQLGFLAKEYWRKSCS